MTDNEIFTQHGHIKLPLLKVIRKNCIECCGGVTKGIDSPSGCSSYACALWPYRMGKNPFSQNKGNATSLINSRRPQNLEAVEVSDPEIALNPQEVLAVDMKSEEI